MRDSHSDGFQLSRDGWAQNLLNEAVVKTLTIASITAAALGACTGGATPDLDAATVPTPDAATTVNSDAATTSSTYRGEVWADNWSAMYVADTLVMEDSVSINTERSFNEETFNFEATRPFLLNVVMKDFIENDSGLEYIGERNQQMGDGGYIAQITHVPSGEVVAVSSADWKCLTIHTAPLDKSCENSSDPLTDCSWEAVSEPDGWKSESFDDSGWVNATVHSEAAVDPKDGYLAISWSDQAEFIWGADLESHNTILCRVWVN